MVLNDVKFEIYFVCATYINRIQHVRTTQWLIDEDSCENDARHSTTFTYRHDDYDDGRSNLKI